MKCRNSYRNINDNDTPRDIEPPKKKIVQNWNMFIRNANTSCAISSSWNVSLADLHAFNKLNFVLRWYTSKWSTERWCVYFHFSCQVFFRRAAFPTRKKGTGWKMYNARADAKCHGEERTMGNGAWEWRVVVVVVVSINDVSYPNNQIHTNLFRQMVLHLLFHFDVSVCVSSCFDMLCHHTHTYKRINGRNNNQPQCQQ